jgi:hypothetical protein
MKILIFLNIVIRDNYLMKYPAILLIIFYNFVILEKSLTLLTKFQNNIY